MTETQRDRINRYNREVVNKNKKLIRVSNSTSSKLNTYKIKHRLKSLDAAIISLLEK